MPGSESKGTESFGLTHTGRIRERNEDAFAILSDRDLYIVADGMGGHNAGDLAASGAVQAADALLTNELVERMCKEPEQIRPILESALEQINLQIFHKSLEAQEFAGMGCALIIAFANDGILHTCHAGDVRCYVCRPLEILKLTSDHTQAADLVRLGRLSEEEARRSPLSSALTKAVGCMETVSPEYNSFPLATRDRVLLCSDGLWGMVPDETIKAIASRDACLRDICEELVEAANAAGGNDNITLIMFAQDTRAEKVTS
jgi:PPM family protein phosphatase